MEMLTISLSIFLLLLLIFTPFFLFNKIKNGNFIKFDFINSLILGLIITGCIIFIFAWWANFSDQLLLSHYGYNFDRMNESERIKEVAIENIERVKQLEIEYYGIGWPVKGILMVAFYFPYLFLVYLFGSLLRKRKNMQLSQYRESK